MFKNTIISVLLLSTFAFAGLNCMDGAPKKGLFDLDYPEVQLVPRLLRFVYAEGGEPNISEACEYVKAQAGKIPAADRAKVLKNFRKERRAKLIIWDFRKETAGRKSLFDAIDQTLAELAKPVEPDKKMEASLMPESLSESSFFTKRLLLIGAIVVTVAGIGLFLLMTKGQNRKQPAKA